MCLHFLDRISLLFKMRNHLAGERNILSLFPGEIIQNASGLGLHFTDGNPAWNLTTNVNMLACRVR